MNTSAAAIEAGMYEGRYSSPWGVEKTRVAIIGWGLLVGLTRVAIWIEGLPFDDEF